MANQNKKKKKEKIRGRKHYEDPAVRALTRKNDVRIAGHTITMLSDMVYDKKSGEMIRNPKRHNDIGNKSWGKIDFLMKKCRYHLVRTASFK